MSTITHAAPPVSQTRIFRSARRGGSVVEARHTVWSDHEGLTIVLESNGKKLFIGVEPHEVAGLIAAASKLLLERKWKT